VTQTAEALHAGLAMSYDERSRRRAALAAAAGAMPPQRWFHSQLVALDQQPSPP
jgi:trehalose 6-phosphate synthase